MFFIWRRKEIEQLLCEKKEELIGYWEKSFKDGCSDLSGRIRKWRKHF